MPLWATGEESAGAELAGRPGTADRLEDLRVVGPGTVAIEPDWRAVLTLRNATGTPPLGGTEANAVCGIFPFAQPVGAAPGAGIVFSYNAADDKVYLDHVDEAGASLRRLVAWSGYAPTIPPQVTGFEWYGKFVAAAYGREAASARPGLLVYDPVAGTVTVPTINVVGGGAAAARLRFRGVSRHRGTVLGWGTRSEEAGEIDTPDILRWARYVAADLTVDASWQTGTDDQSPGAAVIGTPGLPLVACAPAGLAHILGKATEVFALDGDYASQFNTGRYLGAHGPESTVSMVGFGPGAAWMSAVGPAISLNGGALQLLGTDRLRRRLGTYFDFGSVWAAHQAQEKRVLWLVRRQKSIDGAALTAAWADEALVWDYERDLLYVKRLPATCYSIGTIRPSDAALPGPAGAPSAFAVTGLTSTGGTAGWTTGDAAAETFLEFKRSADAMYSTLPAIAAGLLTVGLTGLSAATAYDARIRHFRNGVFSAYATTSFTTIGASSVGAPSAFVYEGLGSSRASGKTYWTARLTWTPGEFAAGAVTEVYEGTTASFAAASKLDEVGVATVEKSITALEGAGPRYYWIRHRLVDGSVSAAVALAGHPITYNATYLAA